jgi:hypothetical protein
MMYISTGIVQGNNKFLFRENWDDINVNDTSDGQGEGAYWRQHPRPVPDG